MTRSDARQLAEAAATLLDAALAEARPISGGLSQVILTRFASGQEAVVKTGPAPRAEAEMLQAIRAAGAPAPAVLAVSDTVLVLERLPESGALAPRGWAELGAAVRRLHDARGETCGWPRDYAFGEVAIPNAPAGSWPEFWAERRLLPEAPALPPALARRVERLARALPDRLPAHPPPALLHGDLWIGNVVAHGGRLSGLIDPACCHGDAEADLAMLHLFGAPGPDFHAAYGPLPPGAEDRRPIYQLWPAIVHLRLFGGGYRGLVERLLDEAGA
ncbi:MAG: fructosamine kinase family protein [Pseudomonadota bacterium]